MEIKDFAPVSTEKIKELIQASSANDATKKEVIDYFDKEKVFAKKTIGSMNLGMIMGKMLQEKGENLIPAIKNLLDQNKLPILN